MSPRRAKASPRRALARLVDLRDDTSTEAAAEKASLLRLLGGARLARARDVAALHDAACFSRVYPEDPRVLRAAVSVLEGFVHRADVLTVREQLVGSGIAGTPIDFPFYFQMASWLARCWPQRLSIQWERVAEPDRVDAALPHLLPYVESIALDVCALPAREWVDRARGPQETDATFLVRRFERLRVPVAVKEAMFEDLDLPMRLEPGPGGPSRTTAHVRRPRTTFQRGPRSRRRPDLREELRRPPRSVRTVSRSLARTLVDRAREAMVTRGRDLDTIAHASEADVRLVDDGDGLEFAMIGMRPEHRVLLETVYVYLTLKNGVPIGYTQTASLFGSAEINFNVFEPWRGGEAARIYARALATFHATLGVDAFTVEPYQLGDGNDEALGSGAFWFYHKLGYRPEEPAVVAVLQRELERIAARPGYRSSAATLRRLATADVFLYLGRRRNAVMGKFSAENVGLAVTAMLARRFGADREAGVVRCAAEARDLLGYDPGRLEAPRRLAWERWAPLALVLPGVHRWSRAERLALAETMAAKGARYETEFARRLDAHGPLRRALATLARRSP